MTDNMQDFDEIEGSENAGPYADSDYESSTDGQRPGRFYGPDSSWRYYTQDERALEASLQQTENNDLSLALFNVHAMRARARGTENTRTAQSWHSKARWIEVNSEGKMPFQPPPKWTAWPLKPDLVPRSREAWGASAPHTDGDAETYSKPEAWKPSLNLQEELKAEFLRQAKDRFRTRQWEDSSLPASETKSVAQSQGSSSGGDNEQSVRDDEQSGRFSETARSEHGYLPTPLFMADDDMANTILQPTVRHILSRQDDLLAALHRSRRGHRMDHSLTTRAKRIPSGIDAASRSEGKAKTVLKRKRVVSDAVQSDADLGEEREPMEISSERAGKPRGRYRSPGQRDWSEVLGLAAISGWDPSIIDRAARRCAAIFGETMSMRFMEKHSTSHSQERVVDYVPDMVPSIETPVESQIEDVVEEDVYACPHISCGRHTEPYQKRWRLREHLKRAHKYSATQLKDWNLKGRTRGRRAVSIGFPSSEDERDGNEEEEAEVASGRDDFLQPITVSIGRSRDKRTRPSRSRSQSAPATRASGDDPVGSDSAMSSDSEL